ncbi:hypothetical protein A2872_01710 [Candidatus Gottesmanbacteria bacterium RIFCSPHIGHO2_01_FULL_42_12]|uniref:Uncharacterized protein n=1 Tax=Candidatus Gottesmanbacteria bacterium RIFCSPHIGHO2_01_FULL_42_12 TaxID=1798377 RepID=A0A1F5Z5D6_9BACT|nr:MAG: hypothetical protein A2872_01710 [Candidatus Gottesmanbacteria bacterium RIFCSPHIGHO2_01_FULL_42_12]
MAPELNVLSRGLREMATIPTALREHGKFVKETANIKPEVKDPRRFHLAELTRLPYFATKLEERLGDFGVHSTGEEVTAVKVLSNQARYSNLAHGKVIFDSTLCELVCQAIGVVAPQLSPSRREEYIIREAQEAVYHRMVIKLLEKDESQVVLQRIKDDPHLANLAGVFREFHLCANDFPEKDLTVSVIASGLLGKFDSKKSFSDSPSQHLMQEYYREYEQEFDALISKHPELPEWLLNRSISREDKLTCLSKLTGSCGESKVPSEDFGYNSKGRSRCLEGAKSGYRRMCGEIEDAREEGKLMRKHRGKLERFIKLTPTLLEATDHRLGSVVIAAVILAIDPEGNPTMWRYLPAGERELNLKIPNTSEVSQKVNFGQVLCTLREIFANRQNVSSKDAYKQQTKAIYDNMELLFSFFRNDLAVPAVVRETLAIFDSKQDLAKTYLERSGPYLEQSPLNVNRFMKYRPLSESIRFLKTRIVVDALESMVSENVSLLSAKGIFRLLGRWRNVSLADLSSARLMDSLYHSANNMAESITFFNNGSHDTPHSFKRFVELGEVIFLRMIEGMRYLVHKPRWDGKRLAIQIASSCLCPLRNAFAHINSFFSARTW